MATATKSDTRLEIVERKVMLSGLTDIMFDRYAGNNKSQLNWTQKMYLIPETSVLCLPVLNIGSYLSGTNTESAAMRLYGRSGRKIAKACLAFVTIKANNGKDKDYVPFTRDGKEIQVGKFTDRKDELSGIYLDRRVARLAKGIPNPKERPVLPLPWELSFTLSIYPNKEIMEADIMKLFIEGGIMIGFGTYRGVYGKFEVKSWE